MVLVVISVVVMAVVNSGNDSSGGSDSGSSSLLEDVYNITLRRIVVCSFDYFSCQLTRINQLLKGQEPASIIQVKIVASF